MTGKVWLVGAGPGDEGLLTVKGKDVLSRAEVVVYDRLIGEELLLIAPEGAEFIDVGKRAGNHTMTQEEINRLLAGKAQEGKRVVRLKGGDPFVFGRGGEELLELKEAEVPFEVVPGVTSAAAVPAYAGIPVTHRDCASSLHIITAHKKRGCEEPPDYGALAALPHATLVFLMGISMLSEICEGLIKAGKPADTPAAVIEKGTLPGQRSVVSDLEHLAEEVCRREIGTPGIIVVGEVCALVGKLSWREKRTLDGARVFVTRPENKASRLRDMLYDRGAQVVQLPCIVCETAGEESVWEWKRAAAEAESFQWLVFTSETAVSFFFERLKQDRVDIRRFAGARFAAVGKGSAAALKGRGIFADYVPDNACAKELAAGLAEIAGKEERMLVFKPEGLTGGVDEMLSEKGFSVNSVCLYRTAGACGKAEAESAAGVRPADGEEPTGRDELKAGVKPAGEDVPAGVRLTDGEEPKAGEKPAGVRLAAGAGRRRAAQAPELREQDLAVFASASAVRGFMDFFGENTASLRAVCIGEKTAEAARAAGMQVFISEEAAMEALVTKTEEVWNKGTGKK